jgi:hypothetical protein
LPASPNPRARRGHRAAWLAPVLLMTATAGAQRPRATEYDLKAAFLFNFTHFVEWPADAFVAAESPLLLCVLGRDPFGPVLDELVRGERAAGRPLAVRRVERPQEAAGCQLLFLAGEEKPSALRAVPGVREGRVLTVGETADFLSHGGLLRFELRDNRIRLQVNGPALDRSRLRLSSKLLRLAETVRPAPP